MFCYRSKIFFSFRCRLLRGSLVGVSGVDGVIGVFFSVSEHSRLPIEVQIVADAQSRDWGEDGRKQADYWRNYGQQQSDKWQNYGQNIAKKYSGGGHGIGLGSAEEAILVGGHDHPLSLVVGKRHGGGGHQDDLGLQYHHHR